MGRMHRLLAPLFLAGALMVPAGVVFAQDANIQGGLCAGASFNFQPGAANSADCSDGGDATETINSLITKIINLLSAIVGVVAVIMIIVGGLRYITSGGNDSSVTGAKNTILYAIIGLVIVALAQIIVRFVLKQVTDAA